MQYICSVKHLVWCPFSTCVLFESPHCLTLTLLTSSSASLVQGPESLLTLNCMVECWICVAFTRFDVWNPAPPETYQTYQYWLEMMATKRSNFDWIMLDGSTTNRNVESPEEAVKPGSLQEVVEPTKDPRILQSLGYWKFIMWAKTQWHSLTFQFTCWFWILIRSL